MSNNKVTLALEELNEAITQRASNHELAERAKAISSRIGSLSFDNTALYVAGALSFATLLVCLISPYSTGILLYGAGLSLLGFFIVGGIISSRALSVRRTLRNLQELYESNLMSLTIEEINPQAKADELASRYYEFQRGNHLSEITSLHTGSIVGRSGEIPFELMQFHWVDERIVTRTHTASNGRQYVKREKVYDHYYRTALLTYIDLEVEVFVYGYGGFSRGVSWDSSSTTFNSKFRVAGESEVAISKLLKPAIVLLLEELADEFSGLNLEFSNDKTLLISMGHTNLLEASVELDFGNTEHLAEQLLMTASQPKIERLLGVVDEVNRHSVSELRR
jgi:hypothetical protein